MFINMLIDNSCRDRQKLTIKLTFQCHLDTIVMTHFICLELCVPKCRYSLMLCFFSYQVRHADQKITNSGCHVMNKMALVCWEERWFMSGEFLMLIVTLAMTMIVQFHSRTVHVRGRTLNGMNYSYG